MTDCPREQEVLEAVTCGCWPHDLRVHADACPLCSELAAIARLLRREGEVAAHEAPLPTSGQVWWRATIRRRAEAAAAAARPIMLVQGLAGACAAGLIGGLMTLTWSTLQASPRGLSAWVAATVSRQGQRLEEVATALAMQQGLLMLAIALAAGLVLMPLVLYVGFSED